MCKFKEWIMTLFSLLFDICEINLFVSMHKFYCFCLYEYATYRRLPGRRERAHALFARQKGTNRYVVIK